MTPDDDKYTGTTMDNNIKRLLQAAFTPVAAALSFKRGLLLRLREVSERLTGKELPEFRENLLDDNLRRLVTSTTAPDVALPGFRERLYTQIVAAGNARRQPHVPVWVSAVTAPAAIVLLLGFFIYPNFWADRGTEVTAQINQGTGTAITEKPLFFIWGSLTTTDRMDSGDTLSLAAGDVLATGSGSTAVVNLMNDSSITIYANSRLVISEMAAESGQSPAAVAVRLETGKASSEINHFSYQIETPAAVSSVLGTEFRVEVIAADHTYLATSEGIVQVTMNGETVQVAAGQEVDAVKGESLNVRPERPPKLVITSPEQPEVSSASVVLTGETDVDAIVTVNSQAMTVDADGRFTTKLELEPGLNPVSVTATSPGGKTVTINMVLARK